MFTLLELADLVNGELDGDGACEIYGVADLEHAVSGEISFVASSKHVDGLLKTQAAAAVVPRQTQQVSCPVIRVDDPYLAIATIHNKFLEKPFVAEGIHPTAVIGSQCSIHNEVSIGPLVSIGNGVSIAKGVCLKPGVVIGNDVTIGEASYIHANCTIGYACEVGKRVILQPGVVVGSDGFGYATTPLGVHIKRPQVGNVIIEDDVEIGANTCIDRATFGTTRIKSGSKIDNLVQLGHNVHVGENSIVVAQTGIAGSSSLGRNVVLGGQVGISGHLHLGDQVMVGAKSGVHNSLPDKAIVSGYPAIAHKVWLRTSSILSKLPDLFKDVRKLKKDVARLLGSQEESS